MSRIFRGIAMVAAAVLGVGALAVVGSTTVSDTDPAAKREENINAVLTADDEGDADDDTTGGDETGPTTNRDASGVSNDGTNSRYTAVSRDRDRSIGDRTKDWTRDGGDRTRDHSRNQTNDRSRNDTRR